MDRHTIASRNSRYRSGRPKNKAFQGKHHEIPADLERRCFEYDRRLVANVIATLSEAVNNGAVEMGMVADEKVFGEPLTILIARMAQRLDHMAAELNELMLEVGNADGYPKLPNDYPVAMAAVRRLPLRTA